MACKKYIMNQYVKVNIKIVREWAREYDKYVLKKRRREYDKNVLKKWRKSKKGFIIVIPGKELWWAKLVNQYILRWYYFGCVAFFLLFFLNMSLATLNAKIKKISKNFLSFYCYSDFIDYLYLLFSSSNSNSKRAYYRKYCKYG